MAAEVITTDSMDEKYGHGDAHEERVQLVKLFVMYPCGVVDVVDRVIRGEIFRRAIVERTVGMVRVGNDVEVWLQIFQVRTR